MDTSYTKERGYMDDTMRSAEFARSVKRICEETAQMLIEKNEAYGDSALNPIRVFSNADTKEQIRVRIDDKLSRLMRGSDAGEDVIKDLMGYLVLLRIADENENLEKREFNAGGIV